VSSASPRLTSTIAFSTFPSFQNCHGYPRREIPERKTEIEPKLRIVTIDGVDFEIVSTHVPWDHDGAVDAEDD